MPSILIADDNAEMLETLERIFALYEFDVYKAENGKKAIEIAEKELPDLIILDAKMPVMDGFEACKILKNNHHTRDIPVVFLTANYIQPTDRVTGLQLGADDYLLKPFNSKELVARVKSIIKRNEILRMLKDENHRLAETTKKIQRELKAVLEHSQVVSANPRLKGGQRYCSAKACQRARKREWQRNKMATDREYRIRQKVCQHRWRQQKPLHEYQREYREQHPQYVELNRLKQSERNKKRRKEADMEKIVP